MTKAEVFFDFALGAGGALILLAALIALDKLLGQRTRPALLCAGS